MKESQRPKKYRCDAEGCGKAYSRPCLLAQHKRSHSNSRPFVCDECGKGFFRETHLKVHAWVHSPDKPLKCSVCSKGFTTNQQLTRHLKTHPLKFKCPYECEQVFATEQELTDHVLSDHVLNDIVDIPTHKELYEDNAKNPPVCQLSVPDPDLATPTSFYSSPTSTTSANTLTSGSSISTSRHPSTSSPDFWENWSDHCCKEPSCQGGPPLASWFDLVYHYDEAHSYVPETLCTYSFKNPNQVL